MKTINKALLLTAGILCGAAQADSVLIRGANVHTMSDGSQENTDVLVVDGEIRRIGQGINAPDDAIIIEANGRNLTPGLFAGVTSIGVGEVSGVEESMDGSLDMDEMRPEFDVVPAYNPHSSLIGVARIEGYSFTMLGAGSSTMIGGQGRMVTFDGGFDSFSGDHVLYISLGGRAARSTGGSRAGQYMLLEQAMDEANNPVASNEPGLLTRTGRQVLSQYADGGTVIFSVNRASDILQAVRFADEAGFKAVISGGAEAWMVSEQLADAEVAVMVNPLQNLPSSFDALGSRLDNAALLNKAGVTVIIDGAGSHNARKQRQFAGNAVSYGLPFDAALAALTSNPASVFGVAGEQGSIERGNTANLVLWSGDPLEVTSVAEWVMVGGKVMPMESRQTKLLERYLPEDPEMPRAYIKP
jgi:imidazolonepropionase-like amidohydrolase